MGMVGTQHSNSKISPSSEFYASACIDIRNLPALKMVSLNTVIVVVNIILVYQLMWFDSLS